VSGERCPRCDRPQAECGNDAAMARWRELPRTPFAEWTDEIRAASDAISATAKGCRAHSVDWRSRALAAEARADRLRRALTEARAVLLNDDVRIAIKRIDAALAAPTKENDRG
jgi:hypothetical protein